MPGLVQLLQAYLEKAVMSQQQILGILGVFQKLIASKVLDSEGFFILNAMFENLSLDSLGEHVVTVWSLLLQRLQASQTPKYVRGFVLFFAFFLCKHSPQVLMGLLEKVQPGLFAMLVQQVFTGKLKEVTGDLEEKLCVVAATKILCEVPAIQQDQASWTQLLGGVLALLAREGIENGTQAADVFEIKGYSAGYTKLHFAKKTESDPLKEVSNPKQHLLQRIALRLLGEVQLRRREPG